MFLIYPYWNVNEDDITINSTKYKVSNLSILECKFRRRCTKMDRNKFLIYPYWNVNEDKTFTKEGTADSF